MQLTPAQIAMNLLLNRGLPRRNSMSSVQSVLSGRDQLRVITGVDLGGDARAWHSRLLETNEGGYRLGDGHLGFEDKIQDAYSDPEWLGITENIQIFAIPDCATRPVFTWGEKVRVIPSKQNSEYRGVISSRQWHFKGDYWYYKISSYPNTTSKRYREVDLEAIV